MSFFSFFTSSGKQSSKQEKHKIYKDTNFKDYFKGLLIDQNNTCEQLIKQIVPYQLGEDIHKFIVLVLVTNEKQIISQRILNPEEQPLKIIKFHNPLLDSYLLYAEFRHSKLLEEQIYHHETLKLNCLMQFDQDGFQRQGVLQKKAKNGQYRERLFKLMKDCLVYHRIEKNKQIKLSYVSLDSMSIEKSKDKNLVFELNVDQKVFTLKAQSKTDYDGWIYSLHNQIFKWKEIKLLNDFDKKIQNIQKTKVDAYKNAAAHSFTLKYLLKQNNYITNSFISLVNQQKNPFDTQLLQFLILCQKIEDQELLKFKSNVNIDANTFLEEREQMHKELIPKANNNPYFSVLDNSQLLVFKQTALNYFDQNYLSSSQSDKNSISSPLQQRIPLQQQLLNLQVHNFNQFMQFPLPNFQQFWEQS